MQDVLHDRCDKTDIFSEKRIYDEIANSCDDKTILADYSRSRILQMTKNETEREKALLIASDLCKFLRLMCCLNNNTYFKIILSFYAIDEFLYYFLYYYIIIALIMLYPFSKDLVNLI